MIIFGLYSLNKIELNQPSRISGSNVRIVSEKQNCAFILFIFGTAWKKCVYVMLLIVEINTA